MQALPISRQRRLAEGLLAQDPGIVKRSSVTLWSSRRKRSDQQQISVPHTLPMCQDNQILFALLCYCMPWALAASATQEILAKFGSFAEVLSASETELAVITSLPRTAISLIKCIETAAASLASFKIMQTPLLNDWARLEDYLRAVMAREEREVLRVLFLDSKNRLLADEVMSVGDVRNVAVYPRQIVKRAIEVNATALILAHNHPSGDPTPSMEDIEITREVQRAAAALGICLHDHVVVARSGCVSLRQLQCLT